MKKLVLITILTLPFFVVSQAQIKFGIKGGITSTSINADEVYTISGQADFDELVVKGKNANIGFQGGVMARITILKMYIQPELLFTSSSGEVEVITLLNNGEVGSVIRDQKYRQIDFPIMLGYKIGPARIQAGPVGTIMLSTDPALDMFETLEVKEKFNGATWGYQVGVGLDILKKVTIDLKYEGNLSKLGDGVKIAGETRNFDSRNSQFIATIGIFF
ncbi:MAG TPA: porin family protein [Bacteroidales bacterium]|nr:porin family protein [Bacteroidales bacterium]